MLSILIPSYDYNSVPLVKELHAQAETLGITFEIICIDDGSHSTLNKINEEINSLAHATFSALDKNIGRSAIRNLLAKKANYSYLLFLDVDVMPKNKSFIQTFMANKEHKVIFGGLDSNINKPDSNYMLRWKYTQERETPSLYIRNKNPYFSFSSACFFIHNSCFSNITFDESLTYYGCEDVLFAYELKKNTIAIHHIENEAYHNDLEETDSFITKTKQALNNLKFLLDNQKLSNDIYRISKIYQKMEQFKLHYLFASIFQLFRKRLLKNLHSNNPSIFVYDLFRLGYFCLINRKKSA